MIAHFSASDAARHHRRTSVHEIRPINRAWIFILQAVKAGFAAVGKNFYLQTVCPYVSLNKSSLQLNAFILNGEE